MVSAFDTDRICTFKKRKIEGQNRKIPSGSGRFHCGSKGQKIRTIDELNHYWKIFLEEYYHNKAHEGIREYYRSLNVSVPDEGISPLQEFNRDTRQLVYMDAGVVGEAFMYHESRKVDKGACISFQGRRYETKPKLIGKTVEIAYDPSAPEIITISSEGLESFQAKPLKIGEYCDQRQPLPPQMKKAEPETSRFLDALEKQHEETKKRRADAGCGKSTLIRRFSASLPKEKYIQSHLNYAGVTDRELFSRRAVDEIFRMSCGIPRLINRICEKSLMYGCQQNLQVIDDQDVLYVSDHEMISGGDQL